MVTRDPVDLRVPYPIIATDLPGVFISPPPPADFDPNTASRQSLIRNGFLWRRPEPGDDPALRAAWDCAFSRRWRAEDHLVPEFEPQPGKTHIVRNVRQAAGSSPTSPTWAGAIIPGNWLGAFGIWNIPTVTSPPGPPLGDPSFGESASWTGLDGWEPFGSTNVLQAGVEQDVNPEGNPYYYAWYEWWVEDYSGPPVPYINGVMIRNFEVGAGQTVCCAVQYIENRSAGQIYFGNSDTGQWFSITLKVPEGATTDGRTAEWIMEAVGSGAPYTLPTFTSTPITFTTAGCCGPGNTTGNPAGAGSFTVDMVEPDFQSDENILLTQTMSGVGTVTIEDVR